MGNCRHSQHTVDHLDRMEKVLDIMGIICITVSSLYHHCIAFDWICRHDSMTLLLSFALRAMFRPLGTKRQIRRACAYWFAFGLLLRNGKLLEAIYRAGVSTLQGINISHLGKRKLIFKTAPWHLQCSGPCADLVYQHLVPRNWLSSSWDVIKL